MNLLLLNAASGSKLEQALEKLVDFGMDAGKDIFVAILIYSVGRFIIKQISVLIAKVLEKRKIETSVQTFLKSLVKILLNMVLAFAIISKLGVETTSFAALLASAGVAVGMALSGNLSNFAGGLIILVFKPFKVGDYIDGPGVSGTIKEIQIFHTILSTLDNRMIYVPNGMLSGNAVINYSKQEMRRVEWVFGVEYGEDVQRVRTVLQRIIYADKRILDTPAPIIVLGSLSASSVDITVRVWVKTADYWNVLYDINEIVYTTFNKEGMDTLRIARRFLTALESRSLGVLCAYYKIDLDAHRALNDAVATHQVYQRMVEQFYPIDQEPFAPRQLAYRVQKDSPITPKQYNYIQMLARRLRLSMANEENVFWLEPIKSFGTERIAVEALSKSEASRLIDCLQSGL